MHVADIQPSGTSADSCCPAGANGNTDVDCGSTCGNGAIEPGESCDSAIGTGLAGACPQAADCVDSDPCTDNSLVGIGCGARCPHTRITTPGANDACCPAGANSNNDPNCAAHGGDVGSAVAWVPCTRCAVDCNPDRLVGGCGGR